MDGSIIDRNPRGDRIYVPALAAELSTEADELVSAAEISAGEVTNAAAIPDVSEIYEDAVAADIPAWP